MYSAHCNVRYPPCTRTRNSLSSSPAGLLAKQLYLPVSSNWEHVRQRPQIYYWLKGNIWDTRFHCNSPMSLTCAEAARSTSPPRRRRRLSVCGSGRPSFSQVREGVGIPEASHWSSRTLLTTTDTSACTPLPLMRGGSDKENQAKCIFSSINQQLKLENKSYNLLLLTQHFQVEVAASLTSGIVSHAGVASCIIHPGLHDLHSGIQVEESEVGVRN